MPPSVRSSSVSRSLTRIGAFAQLLSSGFTPAATATSSSDSRSRSATRAIAGRGARSALPLAPHVRVLSVRRVRSLLIRILLTHCAFVLAELYSTVQYEYSSVSVGSVLQESALIAFGSGAGRCCRDAEAAVSQKRGVLGAHVRDEVAESIVASFSTNYSARSSDRRSTARSSGRRSYSYNGNDRSSSIRQ